jgi:hypothetical protein
VASPTEVGFSCRCGGIAGRLTHVDPDKGTHVRCHCADCRRANAHFGIPGTREDGVGLWQTTPDKVKIDEGAVNLRLMRLSPRGLLRWYAGCCDTPLFNTMATPKVPFVGVLTDRLADTAPLGPVIAEGFVEGPDGKSRHVHGGRVIRRFCAGPSPHASPADGRTHPSSLATPVPPWPRRSSKPRD